MSAIAGLYNKDKVTVTIEQISRIMEPLTQYPADDIQVWNKENVFIGCHAQWITPESVNEQLPYFDYERQMVITVDAIIDNRQELLERLQLDREERKVVSDSLLILLAYQKWGEECPKYLNGDFAFMIWDKKQQKFFGARDFSGGRTLYYYNCFSHFAFCTMIAPLLNLPFVSETINEEWIAEFLVIAGMVDVVDTTITPYKDIKQLPPAHSITVTSGSISLKRYCMLKSESTLYLNSDEEYVEAFQEVFQEAVNSRLRTHKKVGAQLSGGLDSGSIVSFASRKLRQENKQLYTYSYVPTANFNDYTASHLTANETPFIKSTVNYVGGIKDYYLEFQGRDSYSEIDNLMDITEIPYKFYVNSFWLKGIFEQANNHGVGILLNGGRGNLSISWGNALNYYAVLIKRLRWIHALKEIGKFSQNVGSGRKRVISSVFKLAFPIQLINSDSRTGTDSPLINPDFAAQTKVYERISKHGFDRLGKSVLRDPYELRKQHFEQLCQWNASNTLSTKLSLRYALWKRDPTNDVRVIRYCLSLPESQYVQNGLNRALIRRATENLLPDDVRLNMKVRGVQGADWVFRMIPKWAEFKNEVDRMCNDNSFMRIVNHKKLLEAKAQLKEDVMPEHAYSNHLKVLMDSLIMYRFLN
ncbi:asparagine synthase-related protein [Bacillus sp. PS06]|uniref:asparagine synthase-related protein n=1 Tax=Bacillus sp. PS06 TaxID=2764176 RepID=UPI00177D6ABD|nr:asparagine synthase-related protein [Bacillus sp. PS06]MBD8071106.1 asparagine synthetase B [Bacillus sp. PS06]